MMIRKILRSFHSKISITFGNYNTGKYEFFSRIKDKYPIEQISGVVYKVRCSDCSGVYVRKTCQLHEAGASKHSYDIKK